MFGRGRGEIILFIRIMVTAMGRGKGAEEIEEHFGGGVVWMGLLGGFWGEFKGRGCAIFGCCLCVRKFTLG